MSTDLSSQRAAHRFFSERLNDLEPFTKQQLLDATGWSDSSVKTYWSKQFKGFIETLPDGRFRVKEAFRPYLDWRRFRKLSTQVKIAAGQYAVRTYEGMVVYEFYMPLTHEAALRTSLDSLF